MGVWIALTWGLCFNPLVTVLRLLWEGEEAEDVGVVGVEGVLEDGDGLLELLFGEVFVETDMDGVIDMADTVCLGIIFEVLLRKGEPVEERVCAAGSSASMYASSSNFEEPEVHNLISRDLPL